MESGSSALNALLRLVFERRLLVGYAFLLELFRLLHAGNNYSSAGMRDEGDKQLSSKAIVRALALFFCAGVRQFLSEGGVSPVIGSTA